MKACVHQLRSELKTSKKFNMLISEYVLQIWAISYSLLAIGDPISKRDQINAILQGLTEEYNMFIMMIYGKGEPTDIYDIEALLHVQEAQLDKCRQELDAPIATININQASSKSGAGKTRYHFGLN